MNITAVSLNLEMIKHYSADGAIFINHFHMWIDGRARQGKNFHEGRTWYYITLDELHSIFYCYSQKQIRRILNNLVKKEVLIKGNFNKKGYDRTSWYAFKDEDKFNIEKNTSSTSHLPKRADSFAQMGKPIPKLIRKYKEKERDKEKERKPSATASAPPSSSKIRFGEVVEMYSHEYDKLITAHGEKKISEYIEKMNNWLLAIGKPKKYKDYYRALLNWIREDTPKGSLSPESNQEFATKIAQNYSLSIAPRKKIAIEAKEDCIEIYSLHPSSSLSPSRLYYSEKGFKDQLDNLLRKWKLK